LFPPLALFFLTLCFPLPLFPWSISPSCSASHSKCISFSLSLAYSPFIFPSSFFSQTVSIWCDISLSSVSHSMFFSLTLSLLSLLFLVLSHTFSHIPSLYFIQSTTSSLSFLTMVLTIGPHFSNFIWFNIKLAKSTELTIMYFMVLRVMLII